MIRPEPPLFPIVGEQRRALGWSLSNVGSLVTLLTMQIKGILFYRARTTVSLFFFHTH